MNAHELFAQRRSIKRFTDAPVARQQLERLLAAATLAPNHHLTLPWRFYVLGPEARARYGLALGERKARKLDDRDAAQAVRDRTSADYRAMPALVAFAMVVPENPEALEEDYAAVMMGVENFMLAAVGEGLGAHIRTGAILGDPAARAAITVREGERVVAVVTVGHPADVPVAKPRPAADTFTTWVD